MIESKTEPRREDPFFIGWVPVPAPYRRFLAPIAIGLLLIGTGAAATIAYLQRDPGNAQWDTDTIHTYDGIAFMRPYPMIRVTGDPPQTLLLVETGKFGALPRLEQLVQGRPEGRPVRVTGTLLHRDARSILELAEGPQGMRLLTSEEQPSAPLPWPEPRVIEKRATLKGEIIDPKCYLGAMKPGGGKTHKACAMLCISGGVPPMLVTRGASKQETFYLLTTAEGEPANELVLPFVGDQVEVTGQLEQHGDLLLLQIAPDGLRRR